MVRIYNKSVLRWQQLCYWFHGGLEFCRTTAQDDSMFFHAVILSRNTGLTFKEL